MTRITWLVEIGLLGISETVRVKRPRIFPVMDDCALIIPISPCEAGICSALYWINHRSAPGGKYLASRV